jgi:hypothetical protein
LRTSLTARATSSEDSMCEENSLVASRRRLTNRS